jgi:DNA-binding beta-propeller fold protein YncE
MARFSLSLAAAVALLLAGAQAAAGFGFITKWGNYGARPGQFTRVSDVATDRAGDVYVTDPRNRVEKFTSQGEFILQWGSKGDGKGELDGPSGIATDRAGNVYVVDRRNDRVEKFTSRGGFLAAWGRAGSGPGRFDYPTAVATDNAGSVYVVDSGNDRVEKFTAAGKFVTQWGGSGRGPGQFGFPDGIATDQHGNVYVADTAAPPGLGVSKFTSDGRFLASWGNAPTGAELPPDRAGFSATGIATDGVGRVYVSDLNRPVSRIYVFSYDGALLESFGGFGRADGQFENPAGLATDNRGDLYVADSGNHRIQKFGNPSAAFRLAGKAVTDSRQGTARLLATLPGVGEISIGGQGIESAGRTAKRAGELGLPVTPTAATRRRLEETGRATVTVRVTYRPTTPGASLTGTRSKRVGLVMYPNLLTASLEGARLRVRVSCPAGFAPRCLGNAMAVTARDRCERRDGRRVCRQGTRLTTIASVNQLPGGSKVITLRVRSQFRHQVEEMARHPDRRALLVRLRIHARDFHAGRAQTRFHAYGVRAG